MGSACGAKTSPTFPFVQVTNHALSREFRWQEQTRERGAEEDGNGYRHGLDVSNEISCNTEIDIYATVVPNRDILH